MRCAIGRPERAAVSRRVGRQPAQRRAGKIVDPDIVLGGEREPRAVGRHSDVAVRIRPGGRAALRHVPGDRPIRLSAGHRHRPAWDVDERPLAATATLAAPSRSSPRPGAPAQASRSPPAVRGRMPRHAMSLRRRRPDAPSARSARRCRHGSSTFDVPVRRSSTAICALSMPPVAAVIVKRTARPPGRNSGQT